MDDDRKEYFTNLRSIYNGALVNGPFSVILGSNKNNSDSRFLRSKICPIALCCRSKRTKLKSIINSKKPFVKFLLMTLTADILSSLAIYAQCRQIPKLSLIFLTTFCATARSPLLEPRITEKGPFTRAPL